jgi:ribosome biogenesis GTPase / thiamine phosphate phosphatase
LKGWVVSTFGRRYQVAAGETFAQALHAPTRTDCVARGKKREAACGDCVTFADTGDGTGVIDAIAPRTSLYKRASPMREKWLAANATQVAIVVAGFPSFSDELLSRALAAALAAGVQPIIVLNKADLAEATAAAQDTLAPYAAISPIITLSAKRHIAPLRARLQGHTTVLMGQSGMGKSTLINALVPDADARVNDISEALDTGKHTTTAAHGYALDETSAVIDTPGFQEFGIAHLNWRQLEASFKDFGPALGACKFLDCKHGPEPGCAVRGAAEAGGIQKRRYVLFRALVGDAIAPVEQ